MVSRQLLLAGLLSLVALSPVTAQRDSAARAGDQPVRPFRLLGNIYYVGASDVTSFLISTSAGLILLDGGYVETVPQILANIRALGFEPRNVKILLNSHGHYDHAGGLAALKRATGAPLYAGRGDSAFLASGGHGDFAWGDRFLYPPVTVDHAMGDGDRVTLGGTVLTAVATPGHTKGCTTWKMTLRAGDHDYAVLFICSLAIPVSSFRNVTGYPNIAEDFHRSIDRLRKLPCDVPLGPHGSMFGLTAKMARLRSDGDSLAFVDPAGCQALLDRAAADLDTVESH